MSKQLNNFYCLLCLVQENLISIRLNHFQLNFSRYLATKRTTECAFVLMDKTVSHYFDFICWKFCQQKSIRIGAIPRAVSAAQRTFKTGGLSKYRNKMLFLMHQRYLFFKKKCSYILFISLQQTCTSISVI